MTTKESKQSLENDHDAPVPGALTDGFHLLIDAMTPRRCDPRRYELCVLTRMSLREPPNQGVNYRLQCFSAY